MYEVTYVNPSWMIRNQAEVLRTTRKSEVRDLIQRARQYPGSYSIRSITKTTKARGTEHLSTWDF